MNAIKTTAIVEDATHLRLENQVDFLNEGTQVEIFVLIKEKKPPQNWQHVLNGIGVYGDEELSGFHESRKEINKWKPNEF